MIETFDVGSLPLRVGDSTMWSGARRYQTILPYVGLGGEDVKVFEEQIVNGFIDKLKAGFDIPNYPQFRDMNEMFFELLNGIEKREGTYQHIGMITADDGSKIQEVNVIKGHLSRIREETGSEKVRVKICVTGPYTLGSFFSNRTPRLYKELGDALSEIIERTIFKNKSGEVVILSVDDPVLGFLNDPMLDHGSEGREALRKSWNKMCYKAKVRGVDTSMHLHNTSEGLFWETEHLRILEPHVDDPLYTHESTKQKLEVTDKRVKASVFVTLFDNLIQSKLTEQGFIGNIQEQIGVIWNQIRHDQVDPMIYLDSQEIIEKRLRKIVNNLGEERVPYAGPECGLGGWPSHETAIECLNRVSGVVRSFK